MRISLIHGFTGHPADLVPLQEALNLQGHVCTSLMLPGHGSRIDDLDHVLADEWLQAVLDQASDVLIGLSMGGLLSVLAASQKKYSMIILLSPAFYLERTARFAARAAQQGLWRLIKHVPKSAGSDIADPIARAQSQAYGSVSLRALVQFEKVRELALVALPKVSCEIRVFFGALDHTVDIVKSAKLFKNPVVLPRSGHILPVDYDQKELIAQCLKILEK